MVRKENIQKYSPTVRDVPTDALGVAATSSALDSTAPPQLLFRWRRGSVQAT